jgi:hypothetical protein
MGSDSDTERVYAEFNNIDEFKDKVQQSLASLQKIIAEKKNNLDSEYTKIEAIPAVSPKKNDVKGDFIIKGGFIGLQEKINELEKNEKEGARLTILGHLPSYLRLKPLKKEIARQLFFNQESSKTIEEYVKLVNERKEIFDKYIRNEKNVASAIFFKKDIEDYVKEKCAKSFDDVSDPDEEIKERLEALLEYNEMGNYDLYILTEKKVVPKFILKSNVGLVIDLRSATSFGTHFSDSISGLYIESKDIIDVFKYQFRLLRIDTPDRVAQNREFLQQQLSKVIDRMKGK